MKRKVLKITSVVMLLNILTSTVAPTISYALTAGPTAPEYSTFEPVDTTQMVDLATGDFTYNIPLLEVPGPEGGYPFALSYHAGTSPDEESSWVGLGWNLNAGAINRGVSGYPDDFNNVTSSVYDYWSGGSSENFRVGLVNLNAGIAGISYAITYSSDTYKGTGIGHEFITSFAGGSHTTGKDPYGDVIDRSSVGINESIFGFIQINISRTDDNITGKIDQNSSVSVNAYGLGTSYDFNGNYTLSAGIGGINASINTTGGATSFSAFGASGSSNKTSGTVNTISKNFNLPGGLFSYNYLRYWTSEQSFVGKFGSLYYPAAATSESNSFDSYAIPYVKSPNDWNGEVDKQLGGSLPAYDNYTVLGQGVGGAIQPYILDNISLFRQNRKKTNDDNQLVPDLSYQILSSSAKKVNFRFKYDFSNSFTRNISTYSDPANFTQLNNIASGIDNTLSVRSDGFDDADNHLAGSKHIEWFTVSQINDPGFDKMGFIHEGQLSEVVNGQSVSNQIGGFMITNESGVTYHYGLPVYEFNEYSFNGNNNHGESYRKETNPHPYAYTWLLTAITGPDFVDRGDYSGQADPNDWGYWVTFNYGKWTDQYKWRNPTSGYHKQLDQNTIFYSRGQKELYYLDAVTTKSHTAIFEKKIRNDSKGYIDNDALNHDFAPSSTGVPVLEPGQELLSGLGNTLNFPVSTLALSNIYLFENNKLNSFLLSNGVNSITDLKNKGAKYKNVKYISTYCNDTRDGCIGNNTSQKTDALPFTIQNVIDEDDIKLLQGIKPEALKTISLTYDYSLCKNTPNSFLNTDILYGNNNNEISGPFTKVLDGKLTLKSIQTFGRGGSTVIPPTIFEYASGLKNPDYNQNKRDVWGMYKSDYVDLGDENLDRFTSQESSNYVDAWSLTKIKSALGADINIEYESDDYNEVALDRVYGLKVSNFSFVESSDGRLVKLEFANGVDLSEITSLQINSTFTLNGIARYQSDPIDLLPVGAKPLCKCESLSLPSVYYWKYFSYKLKVIGIGTNYITLRNPLPAPAFDIYHLFLENLGSKNYACDKYTVVEDDYVGTSKVYDFKLPEFIGGELVVPSKGITQKGGGLRVRSISTSIDSDNTIYKVDYLYSNGTTSYEPTSFNKTRFALLDYNDQSKCMKNIGETSVIQEYRDAFNVYLANVLAYAPVVQGPGIIYGNVTIKNSSIINGQVNNSPEYKKFVFSTPKYIPNSITSMADRSDDRFDNQFGPIKVSLNKVTIRDYSQRAGNLESVTTYDKNGEPIDEIINTYLNEQYADNGEYRENFETKYFNQGRIDQLFNEARTLGNNSTDPIVQRVITRKEEYPNVLVKTKATNFKTKMIEESYTNAFDYYLGSPSEVINTDSYGNVYKTVSEQAYNKYLNGMGLKVNNGSNKHMLSQNYSSTIYKVTSTTNLTPIGLLSSKVQTWSNNIPVQGVGLQSNIWRKQATYSWIGTDNLLTDGTSDPSIFNNDPFNYTNGQNSGADSLWQKDGEVTLYNSSSLALESKDINTNFSSLRTDPLNERTIFTASNSSYNEMAYSGAEYYGASVAIEGGVDKKDGILNMEHPHTGNSSLEVGVNKEGFNFTIPSSSVDPSRRYRASVWVYFSGLSQNNINDAKLFYSAGGAEVVATPIQSKKSKNWYLINLDIIPNGTNSIVVGCRNTSSEGRSIYFDDFRVHPVDCAVSSYVYDQSTNELIYILDNDNFYTKYEYDNAGRLKRVYKEFFYYADKKVGEQYYNYGKIYR